MKINKANKWQQSMYIQAHVQWHVTMSWSIQSDIYLINNCVCILAKHNQYLMTICTLYLRLLIHLESQPPGRQWFYSWRLWLSQSPPEPEHHCSPGQQTHGSHATGGKEREGEGGRERRRERERERERERISEWVTYRHVNRKKSQALPFHTSMVKVLTFLAYALVHAWGFSSVM